MNASPIAIALAVGMTAGAALIATRFDPHDASGAALDFPDDPVSVAVDADGDVIVGLTTDVASGVVRRFTAAGELRSATAWSGALEGPPFVTEGPGGTVFVAQPGAGEIAVVDAAGGVGKRWTVPLPKQPRGWSGIIAAGPLPMAEPAALFAFAETAIDKDIIRFSLDGAEVARWPVDQGAYDLAVGTGSDGAGRVYVVVPGPFGGSARVVELRLDGSVEGDRFVDGDVLGIDTTTNGTLRMVIRPELSPTAHLDGRGGAIIAGDPSDLAVAPNGELFVVSRLVDHDPGVILHYTAQGCLVETWPNDLLNGAPNAVLTPGPSPCPGQDATATATPEVMRTTTPTASYTPVEPPSPMPTPTPALENGPIYLPLNLANASPYAGTTDADHGGVLLQVQDGGGLPSPPFFQAKIEQSPWFTLYADGTYVRTSIVERPFGWHVGVLSVERAVALVARLLGDEPIFPQLNSVCGGVCGCMTDGSYTRLFLRDGDRNATTEAYLLSWLGLPGKCRPIDPRPTVVAGDRLLAFAQAIAALDVPLDDREEIRILGHFTVYAEPSDSTWRAPIPWPLARPIRDVAGRDTLDEAEIVQLVEAVEAAGEEYRWSSAVPFADATGRWDVGLRVEPPGWTTYCEGKANCPSP
ncbi:MAG: hypothetical protein ABI780_14300 [Ardenticatenales bacterium]